MRHGSVPSGVEIDPVGTCITASGIVIKPVGEERTVRQELDCLEVVSVEVISEIVVNADLLSRFPFNASPWMWSEMRAVHRPPSSTALPEEAVRQNHGLCGQPYELSSWHSRSDDPIELL